MERLSTRSIGALQRFPCITTIRIVPHESFRGVRGSGVPHISMHVPRGRQLRYHDVVHVEWHPAQQARMRASVGGSRSEQRTHEHDTDEDEQGSHEPEFALIVVACAIGLATGAAVVLFNDAVKGIRSYLWEDTMILTGRQLLSHFSEEELVPQVLLPPVCGGIVVGLLSLIHTSISGVHTSASNVHTSASNVHTPNQVSTVYTSKNQTNTGAQVRVPGVQSLLRALSAIVSLGTGTSLGPEGPSVEIGKDLAQGIGGMLKSKNRHIISLLAAGSGAGVAAGFNAPISGVFFAVETVLQRAGSLDTDESRGSHMDSSGLSIAMVLLASVLAAIVSQAGLGESPAFRVPEYRLESLFELPFYLIFGGLCGVVSSSFSYSLRATSWAFDRLRETRTSHTAGLVLLPVIGGLTTGVLALGFPEILYQGFDNVNSVLSSRDYTAALLMQVVVLKIIATSICKGSGLKGGIYAPSIFIGAALGSAYGIMCQVAGESLGIPVSPPQAYALVGVGTVLASSCRVPLTSVLLLFELTRDYLIIVPTLGAVGISYWVSSYLASLSNDEEGGMAIFSPRRAPLLQQKTESTENTSGSMEDESKDIILADDTLTISEILYILEESSKHAALIINDDGSTKAKVVRTNVLDIERTEVTNE